MVDSGNPNLVMQRLAVRPVPSLSDEERVRHARLLQACREAIRRSRDLIDNTPHSLQEQIARRGDDA